MKSSLEKLSDTRVRLTVELPYEELQPSLDAAYKRIAGQVNIPGFRKGKVPARIIEQRFGRGVVLEDALNEAVPAAYEAAAAEQGVTALGQPQVNIDQNLEELTEGTEIVFTAEVDVRPEIELPDYKGLTVEVADVEVTEADINEQLDELRGRFATVTPVERAAADGDLVVVDVSGTLDGVEVEEFSGAGMTFQIGAGNMIEGFDDAVRGKSEGETATFSHTPPEGPLAGKEVELSVAIKGVRERELPAADDEFAEMASEFDTIEELRDDLADRLARVKLVEQGIEARDKLAELLLETVEVPVPEGVLADMLEQHFSDGHGDEEHKAQVEEETRTSLRSQFLLDAIADAEELDVDQEELSQWIMQQAPRYQMTPDQFIQALMQANQLSNAFGDVRRGKALSVVLENAVITDASGHVVDLSALDEIEDEEPLLPSEEDMLEMEEEILEAEAEFLEAEALLEAEADEIIEVDEIVEVIEAADGEIIEVIEIDETVVVVDEAGGADQGGAEPKG